ncbi:tyrosinase family oxidase copper chaperone [Streptomyces sp. NPDC001985]|uniref:tyrosinase family oxidase copper chaperone n=1 Tax=Streptomyces sp. NPDC001985 TaxID=3154406 RepID=UPI003329D8CF
MRIPTRPLTRRTALRALFTAGVVAGTAGALAPVLVGRRAPAGPFRRAPGPGRDLERFAEMYRGRHIQGGETVIVPAGGTPAGAPPADGVPSVEVRIDGRPLHVMRRADGSYLSSVNHYESFPTLREVARAAVDDLGGARLAPHPAH